VPVGVLALEPMVDEQAVVWALLAAANLLETEHIEDLRAELAETADFE
jgi:hypothetical protein